jgi:Icc-related predicted phosphoesterase
MRSKPVRIFFAADVHGSENVWRKWLSVPTFYQADILIMAGDLTGKTVIPIIKTNGSYVTKAFGQEFKANNEKELETIKEKLLLGGSYPYVCTRKEVDEMKKSQDKVDEVFKHIVVDNIKRWLTLVEEKVPRNVKVVVMPGNDDFFEIDEPIKNNRRVIYPLGKAVNLCFDYEMISLDYTNPTPWNSPRECPEEELAKKLEDAAELVKVEWSRVICNFHCPPYSTKLDQAPKLDKNLRPIFKLGSPEMVNVGSKAILNFIEKNQPLLGLHGHIHESAGAQHIGKTLILNPGSEYGEGILKGMMLELDESGIRNWWAVSG